MKVVFPGNVKENLEATRSILKKRESMSDTEKPLQREERKSVNAVVQIIVNNYTDNVACGNVSSSGCLLFHSRIINPKTLVTIRFYSNTDTKGSHELYDPIMGIVRWHRPSKSNPHMVMIGVQFKHRVSEYHGVPQLLNPEFFAKKQIKKLTSAHNALMGRYVNCYVCGHREISQWKLRAKSMLTQKNIFGVPLYVSPIQGYDYCDFNLLQITVCPNCYFASHVPDYFQRNPEDTSPFDSRPFYQEWKTTIENREKALQEYQDGFFSDIRSCDQAIFSYKLAIESHDLLGKVSEDYTEYRKSVSLLMFQAELYMSRGIRNLAEGNLRKALEQLETIFPHLQAEMIIRSALLIALIRLYFGEMKPFGEYMTFLANYNKDGKISPRSPEGKMLKSCNDTLSKAYENRESFNHNKLKNFQMDL